MLKDKDKKGKKKDKDKKDKKKDKKDKKKDKDEDEEEDDEDEVFFSLIDWFLAPTLAVFQLYRGL